MKFNFKDVANLPEKECREIGFEFASRIDRSSYRDLVAVNLNKGLKAFNKKHKEAYKQSGKMFGYRSIEARRAAFFYYFSKYLIQTNRRTEKHEPVLFLFDLWVLFGKDFEKYTKKVIQHSQAPTHVNLVCAI